MNEKLVCSSELKSPVKDACDLQQIWDKLSETSEKDHQGIVTNLIPDGVVKNNKRMRFGVTTCILGND